MPLLLILPLIVVALIALVPFSLVQRYRMGTARQRARGWLALINIFGIGLSSVMFLAGTAFSSMWVPSAFTYSVAGFVGGLVLGALGLRLTRWEPAPGSLHYTPNRALVFAITFLVTARIIYGFWRGVHTWRAGADAGSWFGAAGLEGSMAAGAVVLGYYFCYWIGVRRRLGSI